METRYEIDFDTHWGQQQNCTLFNVVQMLVQHRLKTDPNLENQLRAAAVVGPTVAEYKISERRGSLSGGGAKRSRSRTSSNGRLLLRLRR